MSDSPRSPRTFGVAGLLKESCTVYYANDFKSRSMGRLADLMSAKLREVQADELKFRAVLLFGLYEAYAALGRGFSVQATDLPCVQLEVGVDDESIAVGVSFEADFSFVKIEGLEQRIESGRPENPFEELLVFARQHSSQLVLRYEPIAQRLEIITLIDLNAATSRPMTIYEVQSDDTSVLEVQAYVEMGDLNYIDLTKESDVPGSSINEEELEAILKAEEAKAQSRKEEETRISASEEGSNDQLSEVQVVKGSSTETQVEESAIVKVSGGVQAEETEQFEKRFKQTAPTSEEENASIESKSEFHKESGEQIWPFQAEAIPDAAELAAETIRDSTPAAQVEEEPFVIPPDLNPEETLQKINQIAAATSETIEKQVLPESGSQSPEEKRFRNWADGLVKEITKERAQLHELTKNASKQVRQREMEFKNQERSLKTDIRKKDELIRQKDLLLEKKMEQIAQLTAAQERLKLSGASGNESGLKNKLSMTQKLLDMKSEENKSMTRKMKDLENRLMMAQAKSSKPTQDPELVSKLAATERKLDEFKRINQRLMDSLNHPKEKSDSQETQDLRRKLEILDRQYNESKKSLEKQAFKMRELQEAERKLQSDIQRVVDENRKLRQSMKNEAA